MPDEPPYNPLDVPSVALALALEVLEQPLHPIPPKKPVQGTGIYIIYYCGDFDLYQSLMVEKDGEREPQIPIYVGKGERKGKRKGYDFRPSKGGAIYNRLKLHAKSVEAAENIELADFRCRFRVIEDAFIGLAESVLVGVFSPLWNVVLDGFGNNPTGGNRSLQRQSKWDVFHPGRRRGKGEAKFLRESLEALVKEHLTSFAGIGSADAKLEAIKARIKKYGLA